MIRVNREQAQEMEHVTRLRNVERETGLKTDSVRMDTEFVAFVIILM